MFYIGGFMYCQDVGCVKYMLYSLVAEGKKLLYWALYKKTLSRSELVKKHIQEAFARRIKKKYGLKRCKKLAVYHEDQIIMGETSSIGEEAWIWCHENCDTGIALIGDGANRAGKIVVGENVYIGNNCHLDAYDTIRIGDDCTLADDILIMTSTHGKNPEHILNYCFQPLEIKGEGVKICDGCWIGSRATIMPGVTIGTKSIIGTNSVVTKDIPSYCIAVGIPAKVIKRYSFELHEWINEEKG